MPEILAFSDIQFIFMEPEIAAQGFPSKVYTIMACQKPLLVCSPFNTPISIFLMPIGCSHIIHENDVRSKAEEARSWLTSVTRTELTEMGKRGYQKIVGEYSRDVVTDEYCDLISSLN